MIARPSVPIAITKEHVNAVTRAVSGSSAFADGDGLMAAFGEDESRAAGRAYMDKFLGKK